MQIKRKKHTPKANDLVKMIGDKAIDVQGASTKHATRYLARRVGRVQGLHRFVAGWLFLAIGICITTAFASWSLHAKSKIDAPASGGTYTEGLLSEVNNLNPLFATSKFDTSADALIFNGLLRYDQDGKLAPDLARKWSVDKTGKVYTFDLRKDVKWHDGEPFSAQDVLYTVKTVQDPRTRSPLLSSWQGIKVSAKDDYTVTFALNSPFAPFPHALTMAMLPVHILEDVEAGLLRTSPFNNIPIGTGPFKMQVLRETDKGQQLELEANEEYYRGRPQLDKFILASYDDEDTLVGDLENREITSALDLSDDSLETVDEDSAIRTVALPVRSGVFAFFKTSAKPLDDVKTRRALALAVDRQEILELFNARYQPLKTPQLVEKNAAKNASQKTNRKEASKLLNASGWKLREGLRTKNKKPLELNIVTADTKEYRVVAENLQRQWSELGIKVTTTFLGQEELKQSALTGHDYQIFLYGISFGADPDTYAYWHSSQAKPGGLNFSEWKSSVADLNLEVGRTRLDPQLRQARYSAFGEEWVQQAPAVALYQPRINYSYHQNAAGLEVFPMNTVAERFTNVEDWTVETRLVHNTP